MTVRGQYTTGGPRPWLDSSIEVVWLLALAMVPLAFNGRDVVEFFLQPKDLFLHFAAVSIVGLWGFEWALMANVSRFTPRSPVAAWRWMERDPRNWALVAAAGFGATAVISTLLSPLPLVSLWGRDFATLGYDLYSILSLLVIFFAIALRVREPAQVKRILWVIVGAGVVTAFYGVFQRSGWDPVGYGAGDGRVISSFGNPIFFGSYLVMSIVITLGLVFDRVRFNDRWWLPLMAVAIGIQLTAIWFTGSRGPWVGLAFGLGALGLIGALSYSPARMLRGVSALVAGLLIAVLLTNVADDPKARSGRSLNSVVSGEVLGLGGVGGRPDIWEGSLRLLNGWERPHEDSRVVSLFRPVFGLGPEMYYYSYPLVANPQNGFTVVSHAHSFPLQLVLETGLAGVATFSVLAVSVTIAGISLIRDRRRRVDGDGSWALVVTVALTGALIGRGAEQAVGIARIGDLVPFWALLGLMLAVYGIAARSEPRSWPVPRPKLAYKPLAVATVLMLVVAGTFFIRDVQMLRAGLIAGAGFAEGRAGNTKEAVTLLQRAHDLAPDVQLYSVRAGEMLFLEARKETDSGEALSLYKEAFETFVAYEQRDPSAFITQLRVSNTETEMVKLGDDARLQDLIERTYRIAVSMPAYPAIQALAAQRLLIAGQLELGLELANRAIHMEAETSPQPLAWLQRGLALGRQGDIEGALDSFLIGLEREPKGTYAPGLHRSAAVSYDALGDSESASEHRAIAVGIEAILVN